MMVEIALKPMRGIPIAMLIPHFLSETACVMEENTTRKSASMMEETALRVVYNTKK
jgi:hypothetical protein